MTKHAHMDTLYEGDLKDVKSKVQKYEDYFDTYFSPPDEENEEKICPKNYILSKDNCYQARFYECYWTPAVTNRRLGTVGN